VEYSLPFIAALIGWLTNFLAIKMLFHPRKNIRIFFINIQGIFPKRQKVLAERLGKIVANDLFSFRDIKDRFTSTATASEINKVLDEKLEDFLDSKLKTMMPMLSMLINNDTKTRIKDTLHLEFQNILPDILNKYSEKLERDIDIQQIVFEKVSAFSSDKFEEIINSIMKKEFKVIEVIGGVLGFIIGLIQLFIARM
jgi:uncharacterized membrane protein YheB (UPF0754 family)